MIYCWKNHLHIDKHSCPKFDICRAAPALILIASVPPQSDSSFGPGGAMREQNMNTVTENNNQSKK